MISFIEIRCDISGLSKKYSGEAIVARYGQRTIRKGKESQTARTIIKRECKNKEHKISLFNITIDPEQCLFLIVKKSPHSSSYENSTGSACTQTAIGFDGLDSLKRFLISNLFQYYFFELSIDKLISLYLEAGKSYSLENSKPSTIQPNLIEKNIEYTSIGGASLIVTTEKSHIIPLIFMLLIKKKSSFSITYTDFVDVDIFEGFSQKDLYLTKNEIVHIYSIIRSLITMEENIKIIKSLSLTEAQDFLININKSIETNIKTIEVLSIASNSKNSLIDTWKKKKTTNSQIEQTISNAANNIDSLVKIQKKFLESMKSQINIK